MTARRVDCGEAARVVVCVQARARGAGRVSQLELRRRRRRGGERGRTVVDRSEGRAGEGEGGEGEGRGEHGRARSEVDVEEEGEGGRQGKEGKRRWLGSAALLHERAAAQMALVARSVWLDRGEAGRSGEDAGQSRPDRLRSSTAPLRGIICARVPHSESSRGREASVERWSGEERRGERVAGSEPSGRAVGASKAAQRG